MERGAFYDDSDSVSFHAFLQPLTGALEVFREAPNPTAILFEQVHAILAQVWNTLTAAELEEQAKAIRLLIRAEERHALASSIATQLRMRPDMKDVPLSICEFCYGVWSQVIALERLTEVGPSENGVVTAIRQPTYEVLVDDLIWSVKPRNAGRDTEQLLQRIPALLAKIREGLGSIDCPQQEVGRLLDVLMHEHRQALLRAPGAPAKLATMAMKSNQSVWPTRAEAKGSGFYDEPGGYQKETVAELSESIGKGGSKAEDIKGTSACIPEFRETELKNGQWLSLKQGAKTTNMRLNWVSPQRSFYLFTTSSAQNFTLSNKTLNLMIENGHLSLISDSTVMNDTLNAITRIALKNSIER